LVQPVSGFQVASDHSIEVVAMDWGRLWLIVGRS
jgi:hypothetical protein